MKGLHLVPFEKDPEYYYLKQGERVLCILTPNDVQLLVSECGPAEEAEYARQQVKECYARIIRNQ